MNVLTVVRPWSFRSVRVVALFLLTLGFLPKAWAQTLEWDSTISYNGTSTDFTSAVPNPISLSSTVSMSGTGVTTATPMGGGQYSITSVFDITTLTIGITGTENSITPFNIAGSSGITFATTPFTTTSVSPLPAPLVSGAEYTGSVANDTEYPSGGILVPGSGLEMLSFNGAAFFFLGDGSAPTGANDFFTYGDMQLGLNYVYQEAPDPTVNYVGSGSITFSSTPNTVPDSSSIVVEALMLLAAGAALFRFAAPESKPARVRRQQ